MVATKECPTCGAQNDSIFTNCVFCKTSLPKEDENSITNDELVMKASEWVGKSSEPYLVITSPNANQWTGKGTIRMMQAEVTGNAEKYLTLLEIRATSNPTLAIIHQSLRNKLDKNSKSGSKKKVLNIVIPLLILVAIIGFSLFMASQENSKEYTYQENLDKVEMQIEEAIKDKNYDYALILIEKLVWTHKLNYKENQKRADVYDKKRKELKKTITTLKNENHNGNY